jgi:nucleoside-diphosphate-sugar epimerase
VTERVLVAGATGRLGRELVLQLKERGYFVRALGRDAAKLQAVCSMATSVKVNAIKSAAYTAVLWIVFLCVPCWRPRLTP